MTDIRVRNIASDKEAPYHTSVIRGAEEGLFPVRNQRMMKLAFGGSTCHRIED